MITLIIYDGNGYYQVSVNEEAVVHVRSLLPHAHDIVFSIHDDVEVFNDEGEPLESRSL